MRTAARSPKASPMCPRQGHPLASTGSFGARWQVCRFAAQICAARREQEPFARRRGVVQVWHEPLSRRHEMDLRARLKCQRRHQEMVVPALVDTLIFSKDKKGALVQPRPLAFLAAERSSAAVDLGL
jgi:hypothetical protein